MLNNNECLFLRKKIKYNINYFYAKKKLDVTTSLSFEIVRYGYT